MTAGLRLQELGKQWTREWEAQQNKRIWAARRLRGFVNYLRGRVVQGGPRRHAALAAAAAGRQRAEQVWRLVEERGGTAALAAERRAAAMRARQEWRAARAESPSLLTVQAGGRAWVMAVIFCVIRAAAFPGGEREWRIEGSVRAARMRRVMLRDNRMWAMAKALADADPVARLPRAIAWRWVMRGGGAKRLLTATIDGMREGLDPSRGGFSAVLDVVDVRRPAKRKGRQLEVLLRWAGHDWAGVAWEDSWWPITNLKRHKPGSEEDALHAQARALERAKYGTAGGREATPGEAGSGRGDNRKRPRGGEDRVTRASKRGTTGARG